MACNTRNDILNNGGKIINNSDGTISVYTQYAGKFIPFQLTKPCCENIGGIFDLDAQECRWSPQTCDNISSINIVLNSKGSDGSTFIVGPDETATLSVDFDYLFNFSYDKLVTVPVTGITAAFENINMSMVINEVSVNQDNISLSNIYEQVVFSAIGTNNLYTYLSENPLNSGFYLSGNTTNTNTVNQIIQSSLLNEFNLNGLSATTAFTQTLILSAFTSNWLHFHTDITDPTVLSGLTNQKIKLALNISGSSFDVCFLVDNIELTENITRNLTNDIFLTTSPGFELDRIRDNKKSWVSNTETTHRVFNVKKVDNSQPIRYTDYYLDNEAQVLNTKEIDLDINIAEAVETDVWGFISNNPCLLTGITNTINCGDNNCGDTSLNINNLLTQPLSGISTIEDFEYYLTSELIDVKDRKTLSSYPTLRLVYDRYMNSSINCGSNSPMFDYFKMNQFAGLIGNYWVDLIEQVIPATTIWGSTKIHTNTIFDNQKFKYRSYSTLFGDDNFIKVPISATGSTSGVSATTSVIQGDLSQTILFINDNTFTHTNLTLVQMNAGSEFIGSVTVVGPNVISNNNNTTVLNEL